MSDSTGRLILTRLQQFCSNMADRIDDVVYTDESKEMLNIINILVIAWILLGIVIYFLGNFITSRLLKKTEAKCSTDHPDTQPQTIVKETTSIPQKPEHLDIKPEKENEKESIVLSSTSSSSYETFESANGKIQVPQTSGTNKNAVQWINKVLNWIYNNSATTNPILMEAWINSFNGKTRKMAQDHGILIEFDSSSIMEIPPPELTDVHTSLDPKGNVVSTCKFLGSQFIFTLQVTQLQGSTKVSRHFHFTIDTLKATIKAVYTPDIQTFFLSFVGKPEASLFLTSLDEAQKVNEALEEQALRILQTALEDMVIDVVFALNKDFPVYKKSSPIVENGLQAFGSPGHQQSSKDQLLVKVVKANNLGNKDEVKGPFCILELDDPPQRYETCTAKETPSSPFWDESFVLDFTDESHNMLFEIYDSERNKEGEFRFLGLGIVSLEEIMKTPSHRRILSLQPRPNMDKNIPITGTLTVELRVMGSNEEDFPNLGIGHGKIIETSSRVTPSGKLITTTTIMRSASCEDDRKDAILTNGSIPKAQEEEKNEVDIKEVPSILNSKTPSLNEPIENEKDLEATKVDQPPVSKPNHLPLNFEHVKEPTNKEPSPVPSPTESASTPVNELPPDDSVLPVVINNWAPPGNTSDDEQATTPVLPRRTSLLLAREFSLPITHDGIEPVTLPPLTPSYSNSSPDILPSSAANITEEGESLPETALKHLDSKVSPTKSTLIIHSVQRPTSPSSNSLKPDSGAGTVPSSAASSAASEKDEGRASRPKKKTFMTSLRKRLSFRSSRSKSADHYSQNGDFHEDGGRSASSDRSSSHKGTKPEKYLNVPGTPGSPNRREENGSISEISALSGSSNRTFVNERSTLILECNENGILKRYIVPPSLVRQRTKWGRSGTKLHVFNEHTFVARHISGTVLCGVCQRNLTRRPGKQGYQCRDCSLICHKDCHIRAEVTCPSSTINSLEVEYIQDPRASGKPKSN